MISSLSPYDKVTAAGILARAALAVEDEHNPAANYRLPDERKVRKDLLSEIYRLLNIDITDNSAAVIDRITDFLDSEGDALLGPVNQEAALDSLSSKGELPSDLFKVELDNTCAAVLTDVFKEDYPEEIQRIEDTVRHPDAEQHFGPTEEEGNPTLVSLFIKEFKHKFPLKTYTILVAGAREGLSFKVVQAWRIYSHLVHTEGADSIVQLLERFSNSFGVELEAGGKKGNFILVADFPIDGGFHTKVQFVSQKDKNGEEIPNNRSAMITSFMRFNSDGKMAKAALVVGVDIAKYKKALERLK
jgi:hypothetical protein